MKMYKKVIAAAVSATVLMSSTAFAALNIVSDETVMTIDTAKIVINCGTDKIGATLTVAVYEPDSNGVDDMFDGTAYNVTDPAVLASALSYTGQHVVDGDGKITVEYQPKGLKGNYIIRVGGEKMYVTETLGFTYIAENEAQAILDAIKAEPTTEKVAEVFITNENPNVITKYTTVGIADAIMYDGVFTELDDAQKEAVYANIAKNIQDAETPEDLVDLFNNAVYIEMLNTEAEDKVIGFIDTYKALSGMEAVNAYKGIRADADFFKAAVEANAAKAIEEFNFSGMNIADANGAVAEILAVAALSYADTYGVLDSTIAILADEIKAAGGKMDEYTSYGKRLEIAIELLKAQPYTDLKNFADELNSHFEEETTTVTPGTSDNFGVQSGSSSGGSSGGSGGGGNVISRPIPSNDVKAETSKAGKTPATVEDPKPAEKPAETPAEIPGVFADLKGYEWATDAIKTLKEQNIINGKNENEFKPADTVLREEFAKMIMMSTLPAAVDSAKTETSFEDLDMAAWYAPYITAAVENKIINGYTDTVFGLGDTISREDMAVMCYRAVLAAGIELDAARDDHKFDDEISEYAKEAVSALYKAGVINGHSESEFGAKDTATRAEAAMILYNIISKYGK